MSRQEQQCDAAVLVDYDPLVTKSDPRSFRRSHPPLLRAVGANDPPVVSGRERGLRRSVLVVSAFLCRSSHCPSKSDPTTLPRHLGDDYVVTVVVSWCLTDSAMAVTYRMVGKESGKHAMLVV